MKKSGDSPLQEVPAVTRPFGAPSKRGASLGVPRSPIGALMGITLKTEIVELLSSRGVLAYVAVLQADGTESTTAALAGLVKAQTTVMLDGLKELLTVAPELIAKAAKNKWRCGIVKAGDGVIVQALDSQAECRRRELLDDLKASWEWANPGMAFTMDGMDGRAVGKFLNQYRDWTRPMWKRALFNRFTSEATIPSAPIYRWLGTLVEYASWPKDRYGKTMKNGGGKHEKAVAVEQGNRAARESVLSGL